MKKKYKCDILQTTIYWWCKIYGKLGIKSFDNLAKEVNRINMIIKNAKCVELNTKITNVTQTLHKRYTNVKDDIRLYKCLFCNENYEKKFGENLIKRFANTYKFSYNDINKFIYLLQKKVFTHMNT